MIIAQAASPGGEIVLREGSAGYEVIVDGHFLMSDGSGPSSLALVETGLARITAGSGLKVLIAGLGLGFSLKAALNDPRVAEAVVVELEPQLVAWHNRGLIRGTASLVHDPRSRIVNRDFLDYLAAAEEQFDLIALDIDNGPDWLSHPANIRLYRPELLAALKDVLRHNGVLTVWSADSAPQLKTELKKIFSQVTEEMVLDQDGAGRPIEAFIYVCL